MNANTADTNQLPEEILQLENMTTEQKILAAAEQEFLDKGFSGARTTAIAQAAGVTHAMWHYYFRSKDKLFEKIITDKMSELGKLMLESLITSNLPLFEKIRTIITGHLDFIGANPKLPFFFVREVYSNPERMKLIADMLHTHAEKSINRLQLEINEANARGECRKVNAEMLILDIVSLNIFSFLAQPVLDTVLPELFSDKKRFLELRKKENIETIMRKIKLG